MNYLIIAAVSYFIALFTLFVIRKILENILTDEEKEMMNEMTRKILEDPLNIK